jgi:hypothetical protein
MPLLDEPDLLDCRVQVVARINDEQDGLSLGQHGCNEIINAWCRSDDAEICLTQNSRQAFSEQATRPQEHDRKRSASHDALRDLATRDEISCSSPNGTKPAAFPPFAQSNF